MNIYPDLPVWFFFFPHFVEDSGAGGNSILIIQLIGATRPSLGSFMPTPLQILHWDFYS